MPKVRFDVPDVELAGVADWGRERAPAQARNRQRGDRACVTPRKKNRKGCRPGSAGHRGVFNVLGDSGRGRG